MYTYPGTQVVCAAFTKSRFLSYRYTFEICAGLRKSGTNVRAIFRNKSRANEGYRNRAKVGEF